MRRRFSYRYVAPVQLADGWPVSTLQAEGIDQAAIERLIRVHGRYNGISDLDLLIAFTGGNYGNPVLIRAQREFVPDAILPAVSP